MHKDYLKENMYLDLLLKSTGVFLASDFFGFRHVTKQAMGVRSFFSGKHKNVSGPCAFTMA